MSYPGHRRDQLIINPHPLHLFQTIFHFFRHIFMHNIPSAQHHQALRTISDPRSRACLYFTSIFPTLQWLIEDWNCVIMLTSGSRNKRRGL